MENKKRKADELTTGEGEVPGEEAADASVPEPKVAAVAESSENTTRAASKDADAPSQPFGALPAGSGFSAYAKINPFAMATANAKSSSFGFGAASSTPKDGSVGALRPNFTMPAPLSVPSPRSPKANPFSSPSPAHNPFMTIVESKDDLWKAMAKDKLSHEEAAKSSLFESANKKPRTTQFGYSGNGSGFGDSQQGSEAANEPSEVGKSMFARNDDEEEEDGDEDADGSGSPQAAAVYTTYALPEHAVVVTGEEQDDCLLQVRVKIFRLNRKEAEQSPAAAVALAAPKGTKDSDLGAGVVAEQRSSIDSSDDGKACTNEHAKRDAKTEGMSMDLSGAEWVEMGIGPLKVLHPRKLPLNGQDKETDGSQADDTKQKRGISRVVMRREDKKGGAGTKLLLNIRLDQYTAAVQQSDKILRIQGLAYQEDATAVMSTFLIKTKTAQDCSSLMELIKALELRA